MEALVITLREGMEAALVVGLILAYLNRTGQTSLNRYVYAGLALAILASLASAAGFRLLGLDPENEVLEGTLLAIAAVLVASLVVWMWRTSRGLKAHLEARLDSLARDDRRQGPGLLGFTFFMVFREGIETVLFLAALSLTAADGLLQVIGALAGLGLAALFGVLLARGSVRIDLKRFFGVTSLVLLILAVRLLAGSIHEFSEVGFLPTSPTELAVIGFLVRDSTSLVILMLLVLLPALAMLPGLRSSPREAAARPDEGAAERRKRLAAAQRARRWQMAVIATTLVVVLPLGQAAYTAESAGHRPVPEEVVARGHRVHVPAHNLELGHLHKFSYHGPDAEVRFMIVKRAEDDFAVALDACAICPPVGYRQEGDTIICENCNAPINLATIGMAGGCNPIPLAFSLEGDDVVVNLGDLQVAQARFAHH